MKRIIVIAIVWMAFSAAFCSGADKNLHREYVPAMESALDSYVEAAGKGKVPLDAVIVLQHGKVIGERYIGGWPKDSVHHMWSTSKSYTSLAIGFAEKEGLLSLDDKVCSFFPEYYNPHIDGSRQGEFIAEGTIRDYLVMATGQEEDPTQKAFISLFRKHPWLGYDDNLRCVDAYHQAAGQNGLEDIFAVPFTKRPGSHNQYNSIASYVLSAIVQKVTGQKTVDYLQSRLWEPLGVEKPEWLEVSGVSAGGWGLMLDAETMAKTGQMFLDGGKYAGRQVVPADYLQEATTAYFAWGPPTGASEELAPSYHQGYGYQFWINGDGYNTAGSQGQFIVVLPKYDAVMVGIADIKDDDHKELALMWQHIVPVLKDRVVRQVSMADFGLTPQTPSDATAKIRKAFGYCKSLGTPAALSFVKGEYEIDCEGPLLELKDMDGFTLDGAGSKLTFSKMAGLATVVNCSNVCIRGFEVDWQRPFISQVRVEDMGSDWFSLKMGPSHYPYEIVDGHLKYRCAGKLYGLAYDSYNNVFTPDGSRIKPGSFDNYALCSVLEGPVEYLGGDIVRFPAPLPQGIEPGDIMTLYHVRYGTQLVIGYKCKALTVENMNIHHCPGIALYMADVRDVIIRYVDLIPSEGRVFTAAADAFHIVHCSGNVQIMGCKVDGQGDDAVNVHGRYYCLEAISADARQLKLSSKRGQLLLDEGDILAFVDTLGGERRAYAKVESLQPYVCVEGLDAEDVPALRGCAVENMSKTPTVHISSNTFGARNRARGVLVTSPRHTDILWNAFRSAGAAILVEGDLNYWYESGAVSDLNILHNTFEYCHQSDWGRATITFSPSFKTESYHCGVTIQDNTFKLAPGDSALYYHGVRDIICNL
ncbi:MAG: serine hydrolase domain-containing protein [Candidatus Cryptobacteroides sp.]